MGRAGLGPPNKYVHQNYRSFQQQQKTNFLQDSVKDRRRPFIGWCQLNQLTNSQNVLTIRTELI